MRRAVIFDMDGTLSDCQHRRHHVLRERGEKNWAAWNREMGDDPPNRPVVDLAACLSRDGYALLVCTGRHEKFRRLTETWLLLNDVPAETVYMRADDDNRADFIVKRELLDRIRADGFAPAFVVDDRDSVVAMWREAGLVCLQCAPGDF